MKEKLSTQVAYLNIVLLIIYSIIFVGAALRIYYIWVSLPTAILALLMMWSFYLPSVVENPGPLQFMGVPAFQYFLPIISSAVGIYLNKRRYLMVHLGLILVIILSLVVAAHRGIYLIST